MSPLWSLQNLVQQRRRSRREEGMGGSWVKFVLRRADMLLLFLCHARSFIHIVIQNSSSAGRDHRELWLKPCQIIGEVRRDEVSLTNLTPTKPRMCRCHFVTANYHFKAKTWLWWKFDMLRKKERLSSSYKDIPTTRGWEEGGRTPHWALIRICPSRAFQMLQQPFRDSQYP